MLQAAHQLRERGVDVVNRSGRTHGRRETTALVEGLEILPKRRISYRVVQVDEFDLDAALARNPTGRSY